MQALIYVIVPILEAHYYYRWIALLYVGYERFSRAAAQWQDEIYHDSFQLVGDEIAVLYVKDIVFANGGKVWRNTGEGTVNQSTVFVWLRAHKPHIVALREHVQPQPS